MASPVLSVEKHTLTLAAAGSTVSEDLDDAPDITNCVPFVTSRITAISSSNPDEFQHYTLGVDFVSGTPDAVRITNSGTDSTRAMVAEVSVVEFDPTYVNVYQGTAQIENDTQDVVTAAFGGGPVTVDLSKAWLYFTYTSASGADTYLNHAVRGRITGTSELTFDIASNPGSPGVIIDWYVVECKNTEWSVQAVDISLLTTTGTTATDTFTAVDPAKSFVLGSRIGSNGSADNDAPDENLIDIKLTDSGGDTWDTVTANRQAASGQIDWSGFIVEFASGGNENVYRGTLAWAASETSTTDTIGTAVTIADSMVHMAGHTGTFAGGHWKNTTDSSARPPDTFTAWTITGTTEVTVTHITNGGAENNQDLSWEVIEWDVGGTPRRVMVIS